MLKKLLKYELKATGRIMLPLYLVLILASVTMACGIRITDSMNGRGTVFAVIMIMLSAVVIMGVFIIATLLLLSRFYKNLLSNEGYLMFSIPVTTMQNILSKILSALLWIILAGITGLICGALMVNILEDGTSVQDQIRNFWNIFLKTYGERKALLAMILGTAGVILSFVETIVKVYAAMALGHQWGSHRLLGSFLAYFGFSIVEGVLQYFLRIPFRHITAIDVQPAGTVLADTGFSMGVIYLMLGIAAAGILIYGFITWYFLDRKLNLE